MSIGGALREVIAKLGIEITGQDKLAQTNKEIDGSVGALKALGTALAGSAIVVGLRSFVDQYTEAGSAIQDASDRLGLATDELQELQYAFGQAGVRGEQVNAALTGLSQRMEQARAGTGHAGGAFSALGVRLTDASGQMRSAGDVMDDVAVNMSNIEDPARRVQLATQLFGGAGRRLVGVLHDGSGGLAEMRAQFQELGGGMSEDGVHAADAYGDAMGRLDVSMTSLKTRVAVVLLPVLQSFADFVTKAVATVSRLTRGTNLVQAAFVAGGIALAVHFLPAIRNGIAALQRFTIAQGLTVAGIIVLALVVDDLMAAFKGGPSILGEFVDSMAGVGATANIVQSLKDSWQELGDTVRATQEALSWNMSGRTSAPGTRAARGGATSDGGRTSAPGARASGAGVSATTARQDAAFVTQEAYTAQATRGVLSSVSTSVVDRSNHVVHVTVQHRAGEGDEAFARRVAVNIQRAQESSADANHPIPQNGGR
jgi:hypothetical protein